MAAAAVQMAAQGYAVLVGVEVASLAKLEMLQLIVVVAEGLDFAVMTAGLVAEIFSQHPDLPDLQHKNSDLVAENATDSADLMTCLHWNWVVDTFHCRLLSP